MVWRSCAAVALCGALMGCSDESPASPTVDPGHLSEAGSGIVDAGVDVEAGYAVCPPGLDASFGDMLTRVFSTSSCGTGVMGNCHSSSGASIDAGAGNLLDFTLDASAVYHELLGADGGGQEATNVNGSAKLLRVVPGDAGASMLYIKLTLKTNNDLHYGAGMPLGAAGSVCPAAVDAIKTWIDKGAAR
jgi:hypothetical protein